MGEVDEGLPLTKADGRRGLKMGEGTGEEKNEQE